MGDTDTLAVVPTQCLVSSSSAALYEYSYVHRSANIQQ